MPDRTTSEDERRTERLTTGGYTPGTDRVARIQHDLREDLRVVGRWGKAHPESFSHVTIDYGEPPRLVLFAVGRPEDIAAQLKPLMAHPERLEVRKVELNRAQVEQLRLELKERFGTEPGLFGAAAGPGRVRAMVRDSHPQLASELKDVYRDAVEIVMAPFPERSPRREVPVSRAPQRRPKRPQDERRKATDNQAGAKSPIEKGSEPTERGGLKTSRRAGRELPSMARAADSTKRFAPSGKKVSPMARRSEVGPKKRRPDR